MTVFRVAFLLADNSYSGVTRVFSELAAELVKRGHQVVVEVPLVPHWTYHRLTTFRDLKEWDKLCRPAVHVLKALLRETVRYGLRWFGEAGQAVTVRRYLFRPSARSLGEADWYFLCNSWYQVYEVEKLKLHPQRVIQFIHHYEDDAVNEYGSVVRMAYASPYLKLTTCQANVDILTSHGIAPDGVIFLGINPEYFYPGSTKRDPKSVVLYWGFEERKGFKLGLEAVEEVRRRFPDARVKLLCASDRYPVPEGYERVAALGNQALGDLYRAHSIFIYPSLMEGFGLPPLEAMACGCAVVSTRVGAVGEYATHGISAYLVEPGNASAIAEGVIKLLEDEKLRERLAREGSLAAARYTWSRSADALEQFLCKYNGTAHHTS